MVVCSNVVKINVGRLSIRNKEKISELMIMENAFLRVTSYHELNYLYH